MKRPTQNVIFKTEFDKAGLVQMFHLLQNLFYMKIQIQRPILNSSENALNLKYIIA